MGWKTTPTSSGLRPRTPGTAADKLPSVHVRLGFRSNIPRLPTGNHIAMRSAGNPHPVLSQRRRMK
jgi:hypothetical protein